MSTFYDSAVEDAKKTQIVGKIEQPVSVYEIECILEGAFEGAFEAAVGEGAERSVGFIGARCGDNRSMIACPRSVASRSRRSRNTSSAR